MKHEDTTQQKKIDRAVKVLKQSLSSSTHKEFARQFLKSIGWSDQKIKDLTEDMAAADSNAFSPGPDKARFHFGMRRKNMERLKNAVDEGHRFLESFSTDPYKVVPYKHWKIKIWMVMGGKYYAGVNGRYTKNMDDLDDLIDQVKKSLDSESPFFPPELREALSVPQQHQLQIAKKTLRMPDAMVGVMGGMTKEDARRLLKVLGGYSDKMIQQLEK